VAKSYDEIKGKRFAKRSKALLLEDLERMRSGELGLSKSEIMSMAGQAAEQAGASAQAQQAAIQQQSMASSGAGRGAFKGQAAKAAAGLNEATTSAAAQATSEANQFSKQLAHGQRQEIMSRLGQQQDRGRQNAQYWSNFGLNVVDTALGAAKGGFSKKATGDR
jgi:hypothetical protein